MKSKDGKRRLRVGLVHNWPGARNSELDIILRITPILQNLGHVGVIIDPMGQELDVNGDRIVPVKAFDNFDLVLNLHYLNPKLLSGLSYTVNWNPLAYITDNPITKQPLPIKQFNFVADAFRSHDRVLSAGSDVVDNYVNALRNGMQPNGLAASKLSFHTTIATPETVDIAKVSHQKAKVFYIGVNWEKLSQSKDKVVRHDGLFETLDASGEFVFYGLREQYGISLWEGIKNYKGELPFDGGKSIVDVSRQCGITLVLSSEQHRESGLVSTRVFQACAAGTVIISDKNPFLEKHFADCVYFFEYGATPRDTAANILTVVNRVKSNWDQAIANAKVCQQRFLQKFALEKEINEICTQALNDIDVRQSRITDFETSTTVSVIVDGRKMSLDELSFAYEQFARQSVRPSDIVLICGIEQKESVSQWLARHKQGLQTRLMVSDSNLGAFIKEYLDTFHSHLMFYIVNSKWAKDHIYNLMLCLSQDSPIIYAPTFVEYESLLSAHETFEFCIKGLDGGMSRLDENVLQRFGITSFNNANFLINKHCIVDNDELLKIMQYFSLGVVFIIAYEHWRKTSILPKLSHAVSSKWCTKEEYGDLTFNQYSAAKVPSDLYRDRNFFSAIYSEVNSFVSERTAAWELQQQQQLARHDVSSEYEIDAMRASLGGVSSDVSGLTEKFDSGDFSRQFSLFVYLKHLLRNRPLALNIISKLHGLLAKALKI